MLIYLQTVIFGGTPFLKTYMLLNLSDVTSALCGRYTGVLVW